MEGRRIFWSKDTWRQIGDVMGQIKAEAPGESDLQRFYSAMRSVVPVAEWRTVNAYSDVRKKIEENRPGVPRASPKPAPVVDGSGITRAVEALLDEVVKEVAGAIGLKILSEVQRQVSAALAGLDTRILAALPPAPAEPVAGPPMQHIHLQTSEPGVEFTSLAIAPRDRKPRVVVAGLMNQQTQDVKREFGEMLDLTFVNSERTTSTSHVDTFAGKDMVIIMTRFSSHAVERECQKAHTPFVRITGGVSMLKTWTRKWVNGEVAIAGVEGVAHG